MIDLLKAENEYNKYSQNYDMRLDGIERKYHHSFRVMKISKEIAKSLNLDEEQINLATLIGLLHDIARFEEFTKFYDFSLKHKFDHGDYGVEILKKDNFIRKFIETDKYDNIIFSAIKYHNKFKIEEELDENTLLQCKIIRDADKIDIFYEATEFFWKDKQELIENSLILDTYFKQFMENKLILRVKEQTALDEVIACIAFIYDLNFDYSFKILNKENYISKILDRFDYKQEETILRINKIKNVANEFIKSKNSN